MKIQSISDIITNSSTEVFVVYEENNIDSIKELVNSILSLVDPSKTCDDYFDIEMMINYEGLYNILYDTYNEKGDYEFKEIEEFHNIGSTGSYEDTLEYLETIPKDIIEKLFNDSSYYYMYEGVSIIPKTEEAKEVAKVLNKIDKIFEINYAED